MDECLNHVDLVNPVQYLPGTRYTGWVHNAGAREWATGSMRKGPKD
jgi:hypothetical protein